MNHVTIYAIVIVINFQTHLATITKDGQIYAKNVPEREALAKVAQLQAGSRKFYPRTSEQGEGVYCFR